MPRPRSFRSSGPRRLTQWIGPPLQGFVAVAAGGATIVSSVVFEDRTTLVRTRGMVSVKPQAYTADISFVGAYGIGVVSAEALAAGIASVPEPYSDADWGGWVVWRSFAQHFESITQASTLLGTWSQEVDSKAMRKLTPNDALVFVAESIAGAFSIADTTRQLVKLA